LLEGWMILTEFTRLGRPRTKGSLRAYCTKGARHIVRYEEQTKDSKLWRAQMAKWAQVSMLDLHGRIVRWPGAVVVEATFYFHQELGVDGEVVESHRTPFPTDIHLGDVDKLTRNLLDALTDAQVIKDDSLVADIVVRKRWCPEGADHGVTCRVSILEDS
jgi:hypothetical protein